MKIFEREKPIKVLKIRLQILKRERENLFRYCTFEYCDNSRKMGNEMYFRIARIARNEQFLNDQRTHGCQVAQNYISITPDN